MEEYRKGARAGWTEAAGSSACSAASESERSSVGAYDMLQALNPSASALQQRERQTDSV